MFLTIPIHDKTLDNDRFIFAHPNEKLCFASRKVPERIYTFVFSKANISFSFNSTYKGTVLLTRIFRLVLLHQMSRFLTVHFESHSTCEKVQDILESLSINSLGEEVLKVLQNKVLRRLFFTCEYFFQESYGTLTSICKGYELYPTLNDPIFVPPLAMSKYIFDKKAIPFYKKNQVFNVLFDNYDFNAYVTVVNPLPTYDPRCNYVIRNFYNNLCEIKANFQFQPRKRAKLCSVEINKLNKYIFLLRFHDTYYEVLAIYPRNLVRKSLPTLRKSQKLSIKGTDISRVIAQLNSSEKTCNELAMFFGTLSPDPFLTEKITITLHDWLMVSVKCYFNNLTYETSIVKNPYNDLELMGFGDVKVYEMNGFLQLVLKLDSCSFFYSQTDIDSVEYVQVYYDNDAMLGSETVRLLRFTALLRLILHLICTSSLHPNLSVNDASLHGQILINEMKLCKICHLTNVKKNIILV